jgi:GNAT superfamily N-acetyltransferase
MVLWNNEYPEQLAHDSMDGFENYLNNLKNAKHIIAQNEKNKVVGWLVHFLREEQRWFAMIVDAPSHGKGIGSELLDKVKNETFVLNGWVVDHKNYKKKNNPPYISPLNFYLKNGFQVLEDRLEIDQLSAIKVRWSNESNE